MGEVHCQRPISYIQAMTDTPNIPRKRRAYSTKVQQGPHTNYIGAIRERAGLTQAKAAEVCGISESYLKQLEYGHRPLRVEAIIALCNGLKCQPEDLAPVAPGDHIQEEMLIARFRMADDEGRLVMIAAAKRILNS